MRQAIADLPNDFRPRRFVMRAPVERIVVLIGVEKLAGILLVDADTTQSFSSRTIDLPEGTSPVPVPMQAGDVLFFNGQVIHGSYPNISTTRFRRSLIAHYIVGEAEKVHEFYHPVLTFDGKEVTLDSSEAGGPCGIWVNEDGTPVVEMLDKPIE